MSDYKAILSGHNWVSDPTLKATNTPVFLTYSFTSGSIWGWSKPFNEADKSAARYALQKWGNACGIRFLETKSEDSELNFAWYTLGTSTTANAEFPERYTPSGFRRGENFDFNYSAGTVRLNTAYRSELDNNNSYKIFVLLHEIGHALGLKHPFHQMKHNSQLLDTSLDNVTNTVMSYTHNNSYPTELGYLDIQAIQSIYGGPGRDGKQVASWKWNKAKETLTQIGRSKADKIQGTGVKDIIKGQNGNDKLYGLDGNDTLFGGHGRDVLAGGYGEDIFVIDTPLNSRTNIDTILDFKSGTDKLYLSSKIFSALPKGELSWDYFTHAGTAQGEESRIMYQSSTGLVFYDPDGTGPLNQTAFLKLRKDTNPFHEGTSLYSSDIFII